MIMRRETYSVRLASGADLTREGGSGRALTRLAAAARRTTAVLANILKRLVFGLGTEVRRSKEAELSGAVMRCCAG